MENKIILELAKKEIEDLKLLVETLQQKEEPDQLFVDIALSKAKTLVQEFSLLEGKIKPKNVEAIEQTTLSIEANENESFKEEIIHQEIVSESAEQRIELIEKTVKVENIALPAKELEEIFVPPTMIIEESKEPIIEEDIPQIQKKELDLFQNTNEIDGQKGQNIKIVNEVTVEIKDEPQKLNLIENDKKIIGEEFNKEQTLNERLASPNQESKIKGKPIVNLKSAIGLNDRFMYTRELFSKDSNKFDETVTALDNSESFIEAVEYLENNFKWPKNETSLKFMDLVKRKFEK